METSKTEEMIRVEEQFGEKLETLIPRLMGELGGPSNAAERLGISRITLYNWRRILGLFTRRRSASSKVS